MADEQMTHTYEPDSKTGFVLVIAKEGVKTVDGREFAAGAIDWREPPIPLMMTRTNDPIGKGGHKGSMAVGMISDIWREDDEEGNGTIYGRGYFAHDEHGAEARRLISEGVISGVSADVGGAVEEELSVDADDRMTRRLIKGSIVAVTALPIPAFDDTKVSIVSDDSVVASSGPSGWAPPSDWFGNPNLTAPTPITVTADGRVYGHAALWGTCHVGYRDRCVTPPRSKSNYEYFNVGSVITADGKAVSVGRLSAGTSHAAIEFGAQPAKEHYDHTGWAGAYVHAGEDDHGIWFSGAVAPNATADQIATLRAGAVSGDWRAIKNSLELVGVLAVNTPGFPIPKARAGIVAGAQVSLIASGLCGCENDEIVTPEEVVASAVEPEVDEKFQAMIDEFQMEQWKRTVKGKKGKSCCADCAK